MALVSEYLQRHHVEPWQIEAIVENLKDKIVEKTTYDELLKEKCGLEKRLEDREKGVSERDSIIESLQTELKKEQHAEDNLMDLLRTRDETIKNMRVSGEVSRTMSAISTPSEDDCENEIAIKEIQKEISFTKKDKAELENKLKSTSDAISIYKRKLGLDVNATQDEVIERIEYLVEINDRQVKDIHEKLKRAEDENNLLRKKLEDLKVKRDHLEIKLNAKERTMQRMKLIKESNQRNAEAIHLMSRSSGQGLSHTHDTQRFVAESTAPQLALVSLNTPCVKCNKMLTTRLHYCEECYKKK